jgi:hypothetical protein
MALTVRLLRTDRPPQWLWFCGRIFSAVSESSASQNRRKVGARVGKRLSILLVLVVGLLTAFAFTAGSGLAQTTGTSTSTTGGTATAAATATRAATVAATSASSSAVATGTGGGTVTTLPATGQAQGHSTNFLLIEVLVLGLAVVATGIALRRRASRT